MMVSRSTDTSALGTLEKAVPVKQQQPARAKVRKFYLMESKAHARPKGVQILNEDEVFRDGPPLLSSPRIPSYVASGPIRLSRVCSSASGSGIVQTTLNRTEPIGWCRIGPSGFLSN